MRVPALILILAGLAAGGPALAEDIAGPADIALAGAAFPCQSFGVGAAFWTCLAAAGVPEGGVAFAQRLDAQGIGPGLLVGFREMGAVDLGEVLFPFLANTNQQEVLLNGAAGIVQPAALTIAPPVDAGSQAIAAAHPTAFEAGRIAVVGYLGDGHRQRFVLSDEVVDGCRACASVGTALLALNFQDGAMTDAQALGWVPSAMGLDEPRALALRHGEVLALQVALALHGYQPGPLDGAGGEATQAALGRFLRDNCLDPGAGLSPAALNLLTTPQPYLDTPACLQAE